MTGLGKTAVVMTAAALALAGCESAPPPNPSLGQGLGVGIGAAAGTVIGHISTYAVRGTVLGGGIGALVGLAVGTYLDPPSRAKAVETTVRAADQGQTGEALEWRSDGASGRVTPLADAYADHGRTCRLLRQEEIVAGDSSARDVTACHTADNSWEVVEAPKDGEG